MENVVFLDMDGTLSGLHSEESEGSTLWSKIAIKLDVYDKKPTLTINTILEK